MGVVATLAALVLGLLVASAKSTYDSRESEINQITAHVILIDNLLAKYGDDAQAARAALRQAVPAIVDRIWREGQSAPQQSTPFKASAEGEAFYQRVQGASTKQRHPTRTQGAGNPGHHRSGTSAIPALFASWQLDTRSVFGRPAALDDSLVRRLLSYGACQRDDLGVACHLCAISLRGDLSGTRPAVLRHHGNPATLSETLCPLSAPRCHPGRRLESGELITACQSEHMNDRNDGSADQSPSAGPALTRAATR